MEQFTFSGKEKRFSIGLMAVGLVALIAGVLMGWGDGTHQARVWTNVLHNTVFFTGIAFITLFLFSAHATAYSGWHTAFKRVWEAMFSFLPVGLGLLLVITVGLLLGWHHLYHWAADGITDPNSANYDSILAGKSGFLNKIWYTIATLCIMGVWILFANRLRSLSVREDIEGYEATYKKTKFWAAVFLPVGGFTSFAVIVYWVMSLDPHWYSTLFAWYNTASWLVSSVATTILLLIYLKSKGYLSNVGDAHFHDLGKYLFGFSIFWTYLWFSQFMLIWYANIGEETVYFQYRMENFGVLFFANLIINFVLPFLILIRNTAKRRMGIMAFMAGLLLFGHWIDFFLMTKPGVFHELSHHATSHEEKHHSDATESNTINYSEAKAKFTSNEPQGHAEEATDQHGSEFQFGFHFPGFIEIGMLLGFVGLFLFVVFSALTKASLHPTKDAYYEESTHHDYDVQGF